MSKRRQSKGRKKDDFLDVAMPDAPIPPVKKKEPLKPKTEAQRRYISSIKHNRITFGIGPAGTGKTYCLARTAAEMLATKEIDKIYLTRPAVESGRSIGFLKGDLAEKMQPYMASYAQGFKDGLGQGRFEYESESDKGRIEIVPLNFMQGRSFDERCMVLFDEAQNATPWEMLMFLTRIGQGARMVVEGDPKQTMLNSQSGLIDGCHRLRYLDRVGVVEFTREDIVRDDMVQQILEAYDGQDQNDDEANSGLPDFITRGARP